MGEGVVSDQLCRAMGCDRLATRPRSSLCERHYFLDLLERKRAAGLSCSVQRCPEPPYVKNLCVDHYHRLRVHGDPEGGGTSRGEPLRWLEAYLAGHPVGGQPSSVAEALRHPCMDWPFGRTTAGYGTVQREGRTQFVHKIVCVHAWGPPREGEEVRHLCGRASCIDPAHLRHGTHVENVADQLVHGTDNRGERCPTAKLTVAAVLEIRSTSGPRLALAERFGVAPSTISGIRRRATWKWLP